MALSPCSTLPAMNMGTEAVSSSPMFVDNPHHRQWEQPELDSLFCHVPSSTKETESCSPPAASVLALMSPRGAEPAGPAPALCPGCWGRALTSQWVGCLLGSVASWQSHGSSLPSSSVSGPGRETRRRSPLPRSLLLLQSRGWMQRFWP